MNLQHDRQRLEVDPVCGPRVRRADAAVTAYDHLYHLCSMACREDFVADPRRYVRQRHASPHQPSDGEPRA